MNGKYILEVESSRFVNELDVKDEKEVSRMTPRFLITAAV